MRVVCKPDSDGKAVYFCQILFVKTKGNHNWNHRVTLEGRISPEHSAFFFLYSHVMTAFGLDLTKRQEWKLTEKQLDTSVWGFSLETMRYDDSLFTSIFSLLILSTRFKAAARKAGYPHELFTFHSLRAGFICSALLNSADNCM